MIGTLQHHSFYAMGSTMSVWLETRDSSLAAGAFARVEEAFEQAEQRMSRFREDSELSQLNRRSGQWTVISPPLWNVLVRALELAYETDGLFDPTLHQAILAAGYVGSFEVLVDSAESTPSTNFLTGQWRNIRLDTEQRAVFLPESVQIDLGGIGKGFTAQVVVGWLGERGACLIDAGGDVTAGAAPKGMPGWPVGIAAPWDATRDGEATMMQIWLAHATLATSGVDYRWWQNRGEQRHHILDPRTGVSAETDLLTASVISADACHAEAWATTTVIHGTRSGLATLTDQALPAALINHDQNLFLTPQMHAYLPRSAN